MRVLVSKTQGGVVEEELMLIFDFLHMCVHMHVNSEKEMEGGGREGGEGENRKI